MSNEPCIFCSIAAGEVEASLVLETETTVVFRDAAPQSPVHLLVVPRKHIPSLAEATADDASLLSACLLTCSEAADIEGVTDGYRVLTNVGEDAGQTVQHLHFHLLGGRVLGSLG